MLNKTGIVPVRHYVMVKLPKAQTKTKGGILLPEDASDKMKGATQEAILADIGSSAFCVAPGEHPGDWDKRPDIGDTVIIKKYAGGANDFTDEEGEEYRILSCQEILGFKK